MCCNGLVADTRNFLEKHPLGKVITVYKIVYKIKRSNMEFGLKENILRGVYQSSFVYKPGLLNSSSHKSTITCNESISNGIHVFTTRPAAIKFMQEKHPHGVLLKMLAKTEDLIGVGTFLTRFKNNAVFKKVYLTNKEYIRALSGK